MDEFLNPQKNENTNDTEVQSTEEVVKNSFPSLESILDSFQTSEGLKGEPTEETMVEKDQEEESVQEPQFAFEPVEDSQRTEQIPMSIPVPEQPSTAQIPTPVQQAVPHVQTPPQYGFYPQPQIVPPPYPPYPTYQQQQLPPQYGYSPGYYPHPSPQPNPYANYHATPPQHPTPIPLQPEEKKKIPTAAKVFLWIMGILFASVFLGFVAYGAALTFDNETNSPPLTTESNPEDGREVLPEGSEGEHGVLPPLENSEAEDEFSEESSASYGTGTTEMEPANPNGPKMDIQDIPEGTEELTSKEVSNKLLPTVVGILVYDLNDTLVTEPLSEGSGIILSANGYILTNAHVVSLTGNYRIKVRFSGDDSDRDAKLVGTDSRTDLAVLKVNVTGLTPAVFGNSDELVAGEDVVAIGNPGGVMYEGSVTKGIISAINRPITRNGVPSMMKYIQTDAAINPGNSGGPLVNMYGQVIGINTAKIVSEEYEGIGFAIPSVTAKSIIDDLISLGYVSGRVKIGITCSEVTEDQVGLYGISGGLLILDISSDSGIKDTEAMINDIIVKADGKQIKTLDQFFEILAEHKPNDKIKIELFRPPSNGIADGETIEIEAILKEDTGQ